MDIQPYYRDRFKDYIVLVAGAGNGIGRSCAERFSLEGATVLICDIDEKGLTETSNIIEETGGTTERYVFDIGIKKETDAAVHTMIDKYKKIDVLVYSVGIVMENLFKDVTEEEWLAQINVNLNGAFYITHCVLKDMLENEFGKIIYISSQSGVIGRPTRTAYSASKFGLNGLTQALALEVAEHGINVNAVCPSRIESKMTNTLLQKRAAYENKPFEEVKNAYAKTVPIGRLGLPSDVSALTLFLATEEAKYITGQFISTSGGR